MGRKSVTYLTLFLVLAVLGYLVVFPKIQQQREQEVQQKQAEVLMAEVARNEANAKKLPQPDRDIERVPKAYPRPQSAWRSSEKALHESILTKGRFEILVVPFQVQDHAFARDIRSLMTAQLAMAIRDAANVSVPDPYLVARALGDGERRFEVAEIFHLANALGAKRIVAGYVGHDEKNNMRITLHEYERNDREVFNEALFGPQRGKYGGRLVASDRLKSEHFERIAYSAESTPIDAYQAVLPAMLKFLRMDAAQLSAAKAVSRFEVAQLPESPLALASEAAEPARDAYFLQLMAALTPQTADRERERLIEKSMLAVLRMSSESPDYRVLKARALMHMGLRPAALRAVGTPVSAEEKHLFAVLNGNLPEVRSNRPSVPTGVRAFIAILEENAITAAYEAGDKKGALAAVAALKLPGDVWPYLARRAVTDADPWAQHENIELKALLDRELPVEGFTAEAMLRGAAAVGDMDKIRTAADLSVLEHLRKHIERSAAQSCCQPLAARLTQPDFLDLVEGVATDNLSRRAQFFVTTQGRSDSAIQFLAKLESIYKDHPDFVLARAEAELALARTASGAEKDSLLKSAYADAFNVWYWGQGQTRSGAEAFHQVMTRAGRQDYGLVDNFYADDYPFRSFYPYWRLAANADDANARRALENSSFDFWPVTYLEWSLGQVQKRWDDVDELMKSLDGRFNGNPDRIKLMAQSSLRKGDTQAAEQYYAEAIRVQPAAKELYADLGKLLFEKGAQEKSARVFMSFPGLKSRSMQPVELSNYAYEAGSLYYWSGDFKHAVPLYKVAADLDTGSSASIASATRLALLNGDYAGALRGSLSRARHYQSPQAYRDYFGLLHAMGFSKEAWEGFTTLVRQIDQVQVWETALVGHRIQGLSEGDIAAWAAQEPMRSAGRNDAFAPIYLLRASVTDRMPSPDLPARIAALERPVWKVEDKYRHVARPNADGSVQFVLGPESPAEGTTLPLGVFDRTTKVKVKSDLVYYAEAYAAIRSGKFEEARAALQEASSLYDMRKESLGYLLPAYAYAAVRTRDAGALEKLLEGFTSQYQRFDYHLAKATIAALAGKRDESVQHLNLALVRRPFTERRPVYTEYQYAEVCEWLFEATRDARYRSIALDWARKNQAFHPWFAWAYAMEARLATNPAERGRAIAMAYYLDRNSGRLSMLPKAEVANAVKEYANRNPFRRAAEAVPKQPV